MQPSSAERYDDVPYDSYPFRRTHPDTLAVIATLFGMTPPPADRCRVLELGCAGGGNLIPMALGLPDSRFVGIDLSQRQIADGLRVVEALGLTNIELKPFNVMDIDAGFGRFDYIIAHGLFSWVPDAVQEKILAVCAERLSPNGVAFISYNTYPGWHQPGMVREMMAYHARQFAEPLVKVQQARGLLAFLCNAVGPNSVYGQILAQEHGLLNDRADSYLYHEYLEPENKPLYFSEFMERAAVHRLQYLGETNLREMLLSEFPSRVQQSLQPLATSRIELEQYMDFLRDRRFRHTLLCHADVRIQPQPTPDVMAAFHLTSLAVPVPPADDAQPNGGQTFRTFTGDSWQTTSPLSQAALHRLRASWPTAVPFRELAAEQDAAALGAELLQAYAAEVIGLHLYPPACATPGAQPLASPLARLQASSGKVATLYHTVARVNEFERQVLRHLDGRRDREALLDILTDLIRDGVLVPRYEEGQQRPSAEAMRKELAAVLEECLDQLAGLGLLMRTDEK